VRDKLYFVGFLLGAGLLLFLGRHLLQGSVLIAWGLTFGGTTLAAVFGVILYRLQLQLKASRHELARKEVELKIALEVQRALFPRKLPNGRGLQFSAVCIPSAGISGDYYDVLQLPDGRLVFAIADISGKGISAAILMSNLQALLRVLVNTEREPGEICRRLNLHFHEVTDSSKYATFFFAEWRPCDGRLRYVNAGHNAPLMFAKDKSFRLEQGGMPLGMFPSTLFVTGEVHLVPGDTLVLYSDGITEAGSKAGEEFGEQRLESIVREHCSQPVNEIQRSILENVRQWAGNALDDDMTLVLVRATHFDKSET